jgi:hypothetical protein
LAALRPEIHRQRSAGSQIGRQNSKTHDSRFWIPRAFRCRASCPSVLCSFLQLGLPEVLVRQESKAGPRFRGRSRTSTKVATRTSGQPHCHPLLFARYLADGRRLVAVPYCNGLHDPRVNPSLNGRLPRRHARSREARVTLWSGSSATGGEWGFRQRDLLNPMKLKEQPSQLMSRPTSEPETRG